MTIVILLISIFTFLYILEIPLSHLYYRLFYKHILNKVEKLIVMDFPVAKCPDGIKRRKIMYRYDNALFYLRDINYISSEYFSWAILSLVSQARCGNNNEFLPKPK